MPKYDFYGYSKDYYRPAYSPSPLDKIIEQSQAPTLDKVIEATPALVAPQNEPDPAWYADLLKLIKLRRGGVARDIQLWVRELNPEFTNGEAMLVTAGFISIMHKRGVCEVDANGRFFSLEVTYQHLINAHIKAAWVRYGDNFKAKTVIDILRGEYGNIGSLSNWLNKLSENDIMNHYRWLKANGWEEISTSFCGS